MKCLLTGSRVYGTPRLDSDVDMVVLIEDPEDYYILAQESEFNTQGAKLRADQSYNGRSLRFGKLNIIAVLKDEMVFEAWRKGTDFLKSIRPVTKEQACLIFDTMFGVVMEQKKGEVGVPF